MSQEAQDLGAVSFSVPGLSPWRKVQVKRVLGPVKGLKGL